MGVRLAARRTWAMRAAVVAGVLAVGLLAGGCTHEPTGQQRALDSCIRFGVSAIRHGVTVTSRPAACRGLTRAQVNYAAVAALAATLRPHKEVVAHAHEQELRPLLLHPLAIIPPQSGLPPVSSVVAPPASGPSFGLVALVAWLITVGLGLAMMARWIVRGGHRRRGGAGRARFVPALNFAHLGLAVTGLALWIIYLVTGWTSVAWVACALLLPVAGLGMTLVSRWFPERTSSEVADSAAPAVPVAAGGAPVLVRSDPPPVRHPPALIVAAHVAFATATILFTVLAAIGSG